jgi:hypothetical protein
VYVSKHRPETPDSCEPVSPAIHVYIAKGAPGAASGRAIGIAEWRLL